MQDTPTKASHLASSKLRISSGAEGRDGSADFADSQAGSKQTTQAASGLFLLSQAHQELAKREDAAAAAAAATHPGQQLYSNNNGATQGQKGAEAKAAKGLHNKRKKSAEPSTAQKATASKKVKSNKLEDFIAEEEGYESEELDDEGHRRTKSSNGEGGDDEEKRKSFLERNRQAALKCRQRKKAWLASLQAKVEYLQSDNENLQGTCSALRNEVMYLKSQLMQAQRQMSSHSGASMPGSMEGNSTAAQNGPTPSLGRSSISGSISMEHQQNNIQAMAAAAANAGSASRMGATSGQYQAHAVPRPTHIPGQPNNPQYPPHSLQGSVQAA